MQGQPANTDHLKLKHSPAEALKWELREAFLDNDYAQVKKTAQGLPDDLKAVALGMAVESGSLMMLRIVFDQSKPALSPEQSLMLLLEAAKKQDAEICAYLCERNLAAGIVRTDSYNIVLGKFSDDKIDNVINLLLKATDNKQDALDALLHAAAGEKKYAAMGGLIDRGARLGDAAADILAKVTVAVSHEPFYQRKDEYLALVEKCAVITPPGYLVDCYAGVSGMMASAGMQYNEAVDIFLRHGADPFYGMKSTSLEKHLPQDSTLRGLFNRYEETYTAQQRSAFRGFFGETFTLQDLRQEIDAEGTTGLMLAAKARLLPEVMQKADGIAADDLLHMNRRQQSLILMAAQRGDAAQVLDATYWRRAEPALLARLEKELPADLKKMADLAGFAARLDHVALKEQAKRFKLGPKP